MSQTNKKVRVGVFETNSSSTHSITICSPEQWEQLKNEDFEGLDENLVEDYNYCLNCDFETYFESQTTPGGEKIILFGYHGYDG
jgi:hypothetical protein